MRRIGAVLLDIDGVLTVSWRPVPGAVERGAWLREAGYAVALVTNTTSRTRAWIAGTLAGAGSAGHRQTSSPLPPSPPPTWPRTTRGQLRAAEQR